MAKLVTMRTLVCFVAIAMLLEITVAVDHIVGAPKGGWDLTTDLQTWASSQTFVQGDVLVFQFTLDHNVLQVSEAAYDSCSTDNIPVRSFTKSPTTIPLTGAGSCYFICGSGSHCSQGMRFQITMVEAPPTPIPITGITPPTSYYTSSPPPPKWPTPPPPPHVINLTGYFPTPSLAVTLKMPVGSLLGFGFFLMILLSL